MKVRFSPVTDWVVGGCCKGQFSRDPLPVFSVEGHRRQFWHWQGYPCFDVHPALPLPTMASLTLQGALKYGFGEAVMVCDMSKPCMFLSLDSCQKRFLWTHNEVDLALHPVIGLVLQVGDTEKFPQALGFKSLDPIFRASSQGPCFTSKAENGGDKRLVELELTCEADGVAPADPVFSGHCRHG